MTQKPSDSGLLAERLLRLDSSAVSDSLDILGVCGVAGGIRRISTPQRVAGFVRTIRLVEIGKENGSTTHLGVRTIASASPDEVIVVAHGSRTHAAGWGGLLGRAALKLRVQGVIVDGAVRDLDELVELGLPVFARSATPVSARGRVVESEVDVDVEICGVPVRNGDLVIADGSGVVFVPFAIADEVITGAESVQRKELDMARRIDAGHDLKTVLGMDYEQLLSRASDRLWK